MFAEIKGAAHILREVFNRVGGTQPTVRGRNAPGQHLRTGRRRPCDHDESLLG